MKTRDISLGDADLDALLLAHEAPSERGDRHAGAEAGGTAPAGHLGGLGRDGCEATALRPGQGLLGRVARLLKGAHGGLDLLLLKAFKGV